MNEFWKNIKEFKGYQISNLGRIKSLKREIESGNQSVRFTYTIKESIMKNQTHPKGYIMISLIKDGKKITKKIHRLVAETFIPNPYNYTEINHIDGNKQNNNVNNLEWCSRSYNIKHAYNMGLKSEKGEKNSNSKLTNKDIYFIRDNKRKYTVKQFSKMFNVKDVHIRMIINNKNWKSILRKKDLDGFELICKNQYKNNMKRK